MARRPKSGTNSVRHPIGPRAGMTAIASRAQAGIRAASPGTPSGTLVSPSLKSAETYIKSIATKANAAVASAAKPKRARKGRSRS